MLYVMLTLELCHMMYVWPNPYSKSEVDKTYYARVSVTRMLH